MNFDKFYDKVYSPNYRCNNFVAEVWKECFKQNIDSALLGSNPRCSGNVLDAHTRRMILEPSGPCLAVFSNPGQESHVGILIDGKVLHLTEFGVCWIELECVSRWYKRLRFYDVKTNNNS